VVVAHFVNFTTLLQQIDSIMWTTLDPTNPYDSSSVKYIYIYLYLHPIVYMHDIFWYLHLIDFYAFL